MNLKELAGRVREAVKTDAPGPATPATPLTPENPPAWETPNIDLEVVRAQAAAAPARVETRPAATKETLREGPRPAPARADVGRGPELRPTETFEAAGRAMRWKAPATVPDLATIYKEAGIESPLHGYGVDKLTEMLSSPHLANAPREVRATAAQVALEAARVPLRDIIDDALLRAKALAAFEADKAFELQLLQMRAERRAQVLRDQVDAFRKQKNAEIEEMKRAIDESDQGLAQLRARKRREEERLHRIVTHFVEPRPAAPPIAARPNAPAAPPAPAAVGPVKTADAVKTSEPVRPAEAIKPAEAVRPLEAAKPVESAPTRPHDAPAANAAAPIASASPKPPAPIAPAASAKPVAGEPAATTEAPVKTPRQEER
jgi:hypothetical protein